MLYVIDQRLKAQNITLDKSAQGKHMQVHSQIFQITIKMHHHFSFARLDLRAFGPKTD